MDRDNRWERVQLAYDLYTQGKADIARSALEGLKPLTQQKNLMSCTRCFDSSEGKAVTIDDGDAVVFMNFRPVGSINSCFCR